MKKKTLTEEKIQKIALKKQKEIQKWEREKARPKRNGYLLYLVFLVSLV